MEPVLVILLVVVGVTLAIVFGYLAHQAAKKRREELAALAGELGFAFDPASDPSFDDRNAQFAVFRQGHSRAAYNTLTGSLSVDGRAYPATMGDYTYKVTQTTGKTTTTVTYRLSYLIVDLPFAGAPDLLIRREHLFDKLAGAIGFDDIDFESSEFSRAFHVKSPDRKFAYDVIHPRMMEFLLSSQPPTIDIRSGRLCLTNGTRCWKPPEFRERLGWLGAFFDLWPDYLTGQLDQRRTQ